MYSYQGTLVKDVDGDTAKISVSLGFGLTFAPVDIRLSSINAPEKETVLGQAAMARVMKWFADNPTFIIDTVKSTNWDKKEQWGRYLGTFTPLAGGKSLNQTLVDEGLAKPWNGKGPKPV